MEFIKNSHLYMDDFEYVDMDQIRLVSIYRNKKDRGPGKLYYTKIR